MHSDIQGRLHARNRVRSAVNRHLKKAMQRLILEFAKVRRHRVNVPAPYLCPIHQSCRGEASETSALVDVRMLGGHVDDVIRHQLVVVIFGPDFPTD
jgi:hypothetical protein